MKRTVCVIMISVMTLLAALSAANAGTSIEAGYNRYSGDLTLADRLRCVRDFKFWNHDQGIGYGNCPVYTAPSEFAFRCADGKASCFTNYGMSEAGFVNGWLLIRYETNNGGVRVGYVPPRYVSGFKSKMGKPQFDYIPVTADGSIAVTDNPMLPGSSFARLDSGEIFYILAKYTYYGNWWYIECTVDEQVARGFIDRNSSYFSLGTEYSGSNSGGYSTGTSVNLQSLGNPTYSPLGTTQEGEVLIGYGTNGDRKIVRQKPDPSSLQVSVVYPGRSYPCYARQIGTTGKEWYYIWVEQDSVWGWVSSAFATVYH